MKLKELYVGMRVHWNDPDEGNCSCDGKIVDILNDEVLLINDAGGEVGALPKELSIVKGSFDDRIHKALLHTYNVIGTDLGWDYNMPKPKVIREVVLDSLRPDAFAGLDKVSVSVFLAMTTAEKSRILKVIFP